MLMDNLLKLYTIYTSCIPYSNFHCFLGRGVLVVIIHQMPDIMLNASEKLSVIPTTAKTRHFIDEENRASVFKKLVKVTQLA